jgi:hypothetical protein
MPRIYAQHARRYAALGWATFPLAVGKKVPIAGSNGFKSASADPRVVAERAVRHPNANIAIATGMLSGLLVIDIDPRNGGERTLLKLDRAGKRFPPTVEAISCQGGRHLYYAHTAPALTKRTLGPGIDVKSDGGYIVAPPSVWSSNGQAYRWLRPPRTTALAALPSWIIDALRPPARKRSRAVRVPPPPPGAQAGYRRQALAALGAAASRMAGLDDGRHQAPFRLACRIGAYQTHGYLSEGEIAAAFLGACRRNGALAKYTAADLLTQVRNGLRRAAGDELPPLVHLDKGRRRGPQAPRRGRGR